MKLSMQLYQQVRKPCILGGKPFLSCIENAALMWVEDCYKKGISVDSNKIQKMQSHYMTT